MHELALPAPLLPSRQDRTLVSWLKDRLGESAPGDAAEDARRLAGLRAGDEAVFAELVGAYDRSMQRVARMYVRDAATAEEVVQETWLAVLNGIDRFEGRSSLKTWIFRILANIAKTRGARERRSVPFSSAARAAADEPSVDPDRFLPAGDG